MIKLPQIGPGLIGNSGYFTSEDYAIIPHIDDYKL